MTGSLGELTPLLRRPRIPGAGLLLVGLGPRDRFDAGAAFSAGFAFSKRLSSKRRENVAVALPPSSEPLAVATGLIEGAIVATRGPGFKKSEANRHAFDTLSLVIEPETADDDEMFASPCGMPKIVGRGRQPGAGPGEYPPGRQVAGAAGRPHRGRSPRTPGWQSKSGRKSGFAANDSAACLAWPRVRTSPRGS